MKGKSLALLMVSLLLVLGLSAGAFGLWAKEPAPPTRPLASPVGTAFTYQGRLIKDGNPVSDTCDFEFSLYDAASDGSQVGTTQSKTNVSVSDGLFTVQLDFGGSAFQGDARWLEIEVRCPAGGGSYTALSPRQELTATPYALYATAAPWSGLTGVPAGFADGVDDDTTYSGADFALSNQSCPGTQKLAGIDATGSVVCSPDIDTDSNASTLCSGTNTYLDGESNCDTGYLDADGVDATDDTVSWSEISGIVGTGANQVAAGNHDHWNETWTGSGTGLTLSGGSIAISGTGTLYGVYGSGTTGVYGYSSSGYGVRGQSTLYGVHGSGGSYGVYGEGSVNGVYGYSDSGYGVYGYSTYGDGGYGVYGFGVWGGVYGSGNDYGVYGYSSSGRGIYGYSSTGTAVYYNGGLAGTGSKSAIVETEDYAWRHLYAMESPEVWFEDFGTAQLVDGQAVVAIEPIFAQTVNLSETYHVFLTPLGDEPVLLFVTEKTLNGFTVRGVTLDGEPAGGSFDYRIIAKRLGYEEKRLEPAEDPNQVAQEMETQGEGP